MNMGNAVLAALDVISDPVVRAVNMLHCRLLPLLFRDRIADLLSTRIGEGRDIP